MQRPRLLFRDPGSRVFFVGLVFSSDLSLKPGNFIQPALPGQIMLAKYMKHRMSLEQASHATGVSKCRYEPVPRVTNRDICEQTLSFKNRRVAAGNSLVVVFTYMLSSK